jgi:hypothetical protein
MISSIEEVCHLLFFIIQHCHGWVVCAPMFNYDCIIFGISLVFKIFLMLNLLSSMIPTMEIAWFFGFWSCGISFVIDSSSFMKEHKGL